MNPARAHGARPQHESAWHRSLVMAALFVLATLPYLQTAWHGFIDYDDNQYIIENEQVKQGLTLDGVSWAFTSFRASNWHPVTWLSHMLDIELWNLWPGGHHLTNALLHGLNVLLIFVALRRMTAALWRSALAAALFAVHPLHVESVAWVAERKDVLSTSFGLLAVLAYLTYARSPSVGRYALTVAWFALSLMSKPMLVTLPFVLLLLDFWPLARLRVQSATSASRVILEKVPLLAMAAASSLMTVKAQGAGGAIHSLDTVTGSMRILNAIAVYGTYLLQTAWPARLAVIYPLADNQSVMIAVVSLIVLAAISVMAIWFRSAQPHLVVGWLWFLGTLVPVIGLVQVGMQAHADRYMYWPMIGLLIMTAWSIPPVARTGATSSRVVGASCGLVIVALSIVSWAQVARWKDTQTLFEHTLAVTKKNFIAHNTLGASLRRQGNFEPAVYHLERALDLHPEYPAAHNNLGLLYLATHDYPRARRHFETSLSMQPLAAETWTNLGVANLESGQVGDAVTAFQKAIQLDSQLAKAHAGLGTALWTQRRASEAIPFLRRALDLDGSLIDVRVTYGVALASQELLDDAIQQFELVLKQQPDHAAARKYLESARAQRGSAITKPN